MMATWNDNAITDVGLELLEQSLTSGKVLTLSRAAVGSGHVESAALKDQTELSSALSDVTVLIAEQVRLDGSSGLQLKLQIRNDGISEACTFKQVGIYASDGETEVLFAIYQDANGEEIPSSIDYPDFMEIFTAVIALSQTYDVNVNVSSLVFITRAELEKRLGDKSDVGHTHTVADIADYVNPVNPYLLINPDFLVNQRGQDEYSSGYTVDGWYIEGNKCSVRPNADGILITSAINPDSNTHAFWQKIENPLAPGKYTLSLNVLEVSGVWAARIRTVNASGDYIDSYYTSLLHKGVNKVSVDLSGGEYISAVSVGINKGTEAGNSLKLAWVKLEIGGDATAFVPPDPATELVKCQRYFVRFGTRYGWFGTGFTSSTNRARLSQTLPVPMRDGVEHPTVTVHGTLYLNTPSKLGADAYALGDLIDSPILSENTICMGLVINDGAGLVEPCYGQLRDADSYIDISAEV
jgi:hypothetical protein